MMVLPEVIERYIAAYNEKNIAAMLTCLAEDVVFLNVSDGVVTAETSGKQAFAELAELSAQAFETRKQRVTNAISVGDTTLAEIEFFARVAADQPNGWKTGQSLQFNGASAFRIKDGLIVSIVDES